MQTPKNPAETGKKFLEYLLATGPESNLLYSVGMAAAMAAQEAREVLHPDPLGTELWPDGLPNPIPKKYREDAAVEAVEKAIRGTWREWQHYEAAKWQIDAIVSDILMRLRLTGPQRDAAVEAALDVFEAQAYNRKDVVRFAEKIVAAVRAADAEKAGAKP